MKKYLLLFAITLALFMGACSNKVAVQPPQSADRCIKVIQEPLSVVELDSVRIKDSLEVINLYDSTGFIFFPEKITTGWGGSRCHPWAPYCISSSCPCCNVCIIPLPPLVPWDPDFFITSIQWSCIGWQPDCLPDPDVTFFEPSAGLLLHLKVWQEVTGIMHRPIVADVCNKAGFTFIGDIV